MTYVHAHIRECVCCVRHLLFHLGVCACVYARACVGMQHGNNMHVPHLEQISLEPGAGPGPAFSCTTRFCREPIDYFPRDVGNQLT